MIIERIDRSGHVIDIYTFNNNRVSIGRGYSNDLIINDVYADDKHVQIEFDYLHGSFIVKDQNSLNGLVCLDKKGKDKKINATDETVVVQSGDSILVGKTRLRLLTKNHQVVPAKVLSSLDAVLSKVGAWWFFILCVAGLLGAEAYSAYLADPFSERLYKNMVEGLYALFAAAAYGGVWIVIARTQRQDGRFLMHANILLLASIFASLYFFIKPILVFNLEWLMYRDYFTKVLLAIGAFAAVYASCYQSTNMSSHKRLFVSLWVPGFVLLGSIIAELNRPEFQNRPPYNMLMVSPGLQFRSTITVDEFLEKSDELYLPAREE